MGYEDSRRALVRMVAAMFLLVAGVSAFAQSEIDIEKFTNGQDADVAPGPALIVGSTVDWTYVVTNTGSRPLTNISVTDDQGVIVTCPATTLDAGLSFTCTASGIVAAGQYANIGTVTATQPDSSVVSDSDPSHYFGQSAPVVSIEKRTNGEDADSPPGPSLAAGSGVSWEYEVSNIGTQTLIDIVVTDDQGLSVSCPGDTLAVGASMVCTASGTVQVGQYSNVGTVAATTSPDGEAVIAHDSSHYFGQTLQLVKRTNGIESNTPPGPTLVPGSPVTWTYEVTNPGPAAVTGLAVTDDQGVSVTCPQSSLAAGESAICSASGTVDVGQYMNVGTATATLPLGGTVTGTDTGFYFGNPLQIEKATNGVDADLPPGPSVAIGSTVNWTYVVTNNESDAITNIAVTDDRGVTVTCPSTTLNAGESMTCTASGLAIAGQYANVGTVDATSAIFGALSASDGSHYFGQTEVLDFGDAPDPSYQTLLASDGARHVLGSGVFLGACVDAEPDGLTGTGDDGDSGTPFGTCAVAGDDEDGVVFITPLHVGQTAEIEVVAATPCTLSAWMDYQRDGDWGDIEENLFPGGVALAAGNNALTFLIPSSAVPGTTYARFRCTTEGAVSFTGQASDGEVEDYQVLLEIPPPSISASKSDSLAIDVDGDTAADPGDTLLYTVTIANAGNGGANSVMFNDASGANTTLVVGSVTTSAGSISSGNTPGDTAVSVDLGTVAASGSATITFRVTIASPMPSGVMSVANQGDVSGGNFSSVLTDDPAAGGTADPTITPVVITPVLTAMKSDALLTDGDGDGIADPGDHLRYTITIANGGNGDALAVVFIDTPDPNTALVVGSVTTSAGTVTSGNGGGDTSVSVDIGTLPAAVSVAITFDVVISDPFPAGVEQVTNSGTVSTSNAANAATDDPSLPGASDPTVTPVTAMPIVSAIKTAELADDINGNGIAEPGERLRYSIIVANNGNTDAIDVQFDDTPDANTTLVAGTVATSVGTVTSGNTPGDTSVVVDLGTLASLATVTITFDVIIDPIPPGVTTVANSGTVNGSNFAPVATDSPAAPGSADPTVVAVAAAATIPTLNGWALAAMLAMLCLFAVARSTCV